MKGQLPAAPWRRLAGQRSVPYVLLTIGCVLTLIAGWYVASTTEAAIEARFLTDADQTRRQIEARLNVHFDTARAGAALLSASHEVSAADFRAFVAGLRLPERYPGMAGMGFAEHVTRQRLPAFLRSVRLDGLRSLDVWPPGSRADYDPVLFMEPSARTGRSVVGFDLASDPVLLEAMVRARDSGQPAASARLAASPLLGDGDRGFVLVVPIYPLGASLASAGDRRRALVGFVFSPFVSDALLRQSAAVAPAGIVFEVYDDDSADATARLNDAEGPQASAAFVSAEPIHVAGRDWLVEVRTRAPRPSPWTRLDIEVLLGGGLLSALLFFVSRAQVRALETATRHQSALRRLAQHDALTQLPNRSLMGEHLGKAIAAAHRQSRQVAVLFLDLDRFKHINDSLGHAVGDGLLLSVAARLTACVRGADTVSRLGGDEFVLVLADIVEADHAAARAQQIIEMLAARHDVASHQIHVTVSVGISLYPDDGQEAALLLQSADTAMYQAKEHGRNTYRFFRPDMNARVVTRRRIETGLRRGLERQEFVLHYQPKVSLRTGAVTGVEALVRWVSPEEGLVGPTEFVPIAEDSGLIVPIGRWVLREACVQARAWLDTGNPTPVAINISALEFRDKDFLRYVHDVLAETRLDPRYLELELTESRLMAYGESSTALLQSLKQLGVTIALDDFGTGYSSLSHLQQFPIDVLKIDRSFVHEIGGARSGSPIVNAIISLGRSLQCRVIAEGVETEGQLAFLQASHCGEGQGFYFGRPVMAEEMAQRLR